MAEYALLNSTKIITVSDTVAAELRHFGLVADHTQITTIYPGVTPLRAGKEFINKRPYLLTVGTLEPRKNLPNLIRAFEKSGLSGDFDLLIIGRLAWGNVPAAKGVRVLNAATDETLGSAYSQAHGFICASLYEGFGLPVIEAAAAGLSVACSNIPVFHEVTSGRALFFDPLSENSIIGALRQLAYSQAPYVSDERYLLKYNWKRSASTLSSVLLDMC